MVTVGYGDVTPTGDYETILSIITMLVCCGLFAYVINDIGIIVKAYYENQNELQK